MDKNAVGLDDFSDVLVGKAVVVNEGF